jgi:glyoxylase-like metal-dependent hydrolase (beta-lactamase superfamily II)
MPEILYGLFREHSRRALVQTSAIVILGVAVADVGHAEELVVEALAQKVFAVLAPAGHPGEANAGFIVLDDAVLVIDTYMVPEAARELIAIIKKVTPLPVRYVVNTHWHPDHTHGNASYVSAFGPNMTFISQVNTRDDIETLGHERLVINRVKNAALAEVELVLPNLTFSSELHLYMANRRIQMLFFGRGHTRGDIVVYLPDDKIAFVGDLVTGGPPFARDGYPFAWIATLQSLQQLEIDTIVTGHGKIWRSKQVLADRIRFLRHATDVIRHGESSGLEPDETIAAIDLDAYRDTFEPEPEAAPWGSWIRMLVERGLLELKTKQALKQ